MPGPLRVLSVVGTRPNLVKIAPVAAALRARGDRFEHALVHTGQHYDEEMSGVFLDQLGLGRPDHALGVGSGSHAQQTARAMERLEPVLLEEEPDLVLVPGDVNSTLAAALTASKLGFPVGHVEAGLRSFDRTMPEELNRVVTDSLADLHFVHSPEARDNLLREGAAPESVHDVGNTMIDSLLALREAIDAATPRRRPYLVVTLHRPALVDGPRLGDVLAELDEIAGGLPVVFPVHPRTRREMQARGLEPRAGGVSLLEPLGYVEFLGLVAGSAAVLTDSGGIQEEATFLGVPCFTLRDRTERPVTVELGTNTLLGLAPERIAELPARIEAARGRPHRVPPLWDGRAAERIADVLERWAGRVIDRAGPDHRRRRLHRLPSG